MNCLDITRAMRALRHLRDEKIRIEYGVKSAGILASEITSQSAKFSTSSASKNRQAKPARAVRLTAETRQFPALPCPFFAIPQNPKPS